MKSHISESEMKQKDVVKFIRSYFGPDGTPLHLKGEIKVLPRASALTLGRMGYCQMVMSGSIEESDDVF